MRWIGCLPSLLLSLILFLNLAVRFVDRWFRSNLTVSGWALAFDRVAQEPIREPGFWNVCMACGQGSSLTEVEQARWSFSFFYRCPICRVLTPLFRKSAASESQVTLRQAPKPQAEDTLAPISNPSNIQERSEKPPPVVENERSVPNGSERLTPPLFIDPISDQPTPPTPGRIYNT